MKKKLLLIFLVAVVLQSSAQPAFVKDSLDAYINEGLKQWNIPGLAIAIIKDGKTVVMKGYGYRDVKTKQPVDENTLFMIASNSKLFTGTALAKLEFDKKLSLDDKITKYFPGYSVYDSATTNLLTIKDMLGHHLGTKTFQGDFTFWNASLSRQQIMEKMKLLKPAGSFRQSYGYCNSCFLTAGEVIPVVSGISWEEYIQQNILSPLNMTNTYPLSAGISQRTNVSKPYTTAFSGTLTELPYDQVDNLAPAGSIVSSVKDVAKWLSMQLDSGKFEGRQVLPWSVIQRTRDANTLISTRKNRLYPSHFTTYGLGVFETDYSGRQIFWHTGGADGFVTNTCFVPEEKLAITILTNNDNQNFFEALRYQVLDAYLNRPFIDRSQEQLKFFTAENDEVLNTVKSLKARVKANKPELPLNAYIGNYSNTLYGAISVEAKGKNLVVQFKGHRDLTASLQYMDNGEWLLSYSNPAFGIFPLKFKIQNDKVVSTDIKVNDFLEYDPYTFVKN
ncbi:serine hydrolase [Pedobacter sp. HMF7647]|uniref:Serine hydrolase n=1 Tax=Hufsiella arboris TaxID=2695275 RepID=A0A7K1Y6H7_9SPHI|nr:serine hydrolase [Hufsiella arboris]MXV50175.1 serine hydrolase [Hufsiella arboris]